MKRFLTIWSALALVAMAAACAKSSSPTQPSGTTTPQAAAASSGAVSGPESATITVATPVSPANNAQLKWGEQPFTLVVRNAVTTGRGTLTYSFEVATDSGFSNKVFSRDGIAAGNGQTSVVLDKLKGDTTYFWRAHVMLDGNAGPNSVRSFSVGPEVILQAPVLSVPGAGATVSDTPTLVVNNVQRSGPAGTIVYEFDVATSGDFSSIVYSGTATEQPGSSSTSLTVPIHLDETTYWWRVQATDTTNGVTSPMSGANPFVVKKFDMHNAIIYDNPPDVASWEVNAQITYIDTAGPFIIVDFDRRQDQPGIPRWNDVGFGSGSLQYTLGACFNIDTQWYCSAPIQFWYGRELTAGTPPWRMAEDWYYNPIRWGRMTGHQPAPGETVGFWVGHGNLRGGNGNVYKERSNVVLVPFGTTWSVSSQNRIRLRTGSTRQGPPMLPLSRPSSVKALPRR